MVDPIEIQLDEIEQHVLKTQADVDRLMRDFSKPETGKDLLAQLPGGGGGGGFFDQIIGKIAGGKGAGLLGAGGAAGLAAAGVMKLADIIGDAISQSKILTTVFGTIGKALGLLIDIILLPFLPILTTGIIWLFQGIMAFHRLWTSIWNGKVFQDLKDGVTSLGTALGKGLEGLLTLGIDVAKGAASKAWDCILWIYGLVTEGMGAAIDLTFSAAGAVYDFLKWLWDTVVALTTNTISMNFSAAGAVYDFLKWLWETITSGGANLAINITESVGKAAAGAAGAVGSAASDPLGWLGGVASGGWLGGGETSTPSANKTTSSNQTIVIQGYTDQKLVQTIENLQRRQNNRYN